MCSQDPRPLGDLSLLRANWLRFVKAKKAVRLTAKGELLRERERERVSFLDLSLVLFLQ